MQTLTDLAVRNNHVYTYNIYNTTNKDDIWYYRNSPAFFINSWTE